MARCKAIYAREPHLRCDLNEGHDGNHYSWQPQTPFTWVDKVDYTLLTDALKIVEQLIDDYPNPPGPSVTKQVRQLAPDRFAFIRRSGDTLELRITGIEVHCKLITLDSAGPIYQADSLPLEFEQFFTSASSSWSGKLGGWKQEKFT